MSFHKNNLAFQSASDLVTALRNKEISSTELVEASIARIEKFDKEINAVVVKDYKNARKAAKLADKALAKDEHRPLLGLPMTVKESFNIAGLTTNWGNVSYKNWKPKEDALVIERLKSAGAIILGKTNVPCMLNDWQTYNDIYGTTNNPWNLSLTPGGSSGGSAAALAMGYVALELGSDLAGSLRVPAHFCGIMAHKPSADLVPLRGSSPPKMPSSTRKIDLAVAGPMARTTQDLMLGLEVLAGPDELADGMGYKLSLPKSNPTRLNEFRVLLLSEHPLYPTDKAMLKIFDEMAAKLKTKGVKISRSYKKLPDLEAIALNYALLLGARFSEIMTPKSYERMLKHVKKLGNAKKNLANQLLRGLAINHRDWLLALRERERLTQQWNALYDEFDVVLTPVMPTPAFPHDQSKDPDKRKIIINDVKVASAHQYIWVCIANLFGLPATSIPVGLTDDQRPVGLQILGKYLQDKTTLTFGKLLEKVSGGFVAPPRGHA